MIKTDNNSETIFIRPNWKYYIQKVGWLVLASLTLLFMGGMEGILFKSLWFGGSSITSMLALYEFVFLRKMLFLLTDEQLIIQRGVFQRTNDYVELYRIIDFKEHQNLIGQFLDLKSVFIYSTDRTNPIIEICGVINQSDIVKVMRDRVIYNRSIRNIHEFSNLT